MEDRIIIEFGKITRFIISKLWLFALVLIVFVGGGMFFINTSSNTPVSYSAVGKIIVTQRSGEESGELMDNASRVQPVYDVKEILTSGVFLERIAQHLDFDIAVGELKKSIVVEQIAPARLLSVRVTRGNAEEATKILEAITQYGDSCLEEILPDVQTESLENINTASVQEEKSSTNGMKIGIIMGMAACAILACVLILLYLFNNSIRYKEDVERQLGLSVIGEFKEVKKKG